MKTILTKPYVATILFLLTIGACSRSRASEQVLNNAVYATCQADLSEGYPERAYLAKPILVRVVGIDLQAETLTVADETSVYTRSLHDCIPLLNLNNEKEVKNEK